jgi:hypothetical protein
MHPDRIYRQHRDEALAKQVRADEYTSFVAMPFGERYSYRSEDVLDNVICAAARRATEMAKACRPFAHPTRVDRMAGVAANITEDIIVGILESHIFLADLTFANNGVLIETGAALGLKPTGQIILLQGDPRELHFDISHNRVLTYNGKVDDVVDNIAKALISAADAFERDCSPYIKEVSQTLSSDAIACMNWYGQFWKANPGARPSLHRGVITAAYRKKPTFILFPDAPFEVAALLFTEATRELISKRLFYTEYQPKATPEGDAFGMHATDLGWAVIAHLWPELARPSKR